MHQNLPIGTQSVQLLSFCITLKCYYCCKISWDNYFNTIMCKWIIVWTIKYLNNCIDGMSFSFQYTCTVNQLFAAIYFSLIAFMNFSWLFIFADHRNGPWKDHVCLDVFKVICSCNIIFLVNIIWINWFTAFVLIYSAVV